MKFPFVLKSKSEFETLAFALTLALTFTLVFEERSRWRNQNPRAPTAINVIVPNIVKMTTRNVFVFLGC